MSTCTQFFWACTQEWISWPLGYMKWLCRFTLHSSIRGFGLFHILLTNTWCHKNATVSPCTLYLHFLKSGIDGVVVHIFIWLLVKGTDWWSVYSTACYFQTYLVVPSSIIMYSNKCGTWGQNLLWNMLNNCCIFLLRRNYFLLFFILLSTNISQLTISKYCRGFNKKSASDSHPPYYRGVHIEFAICLFLFVYFQLKRK